MMFQGELCRAEPSFLHLSVRVLVRRRPSFSVSRARGWKCDTEERAVFTHTLWEESPGPSRVQLWGTL